MKKLTKGFLSILIFVFFILIAFASEESDEEQLSKPRPPIGKVINIDQNTTSKKDDSNILGEDIGWIIKPTIKNLGGEGTLTIHAKISTNMGDFSQYRDVEFESGEIKILEFVFWEPTILTEGSYEVKFLQ